MDTTPDLKNPVLHVVVVAFHHKKGCQVEYSYPPLLPGRPVNSSECPEQWKQLPSLALPDGAHNFTEDTVYFHLPSLDIPRSTIYCVSCYRQMQANEVLNPASDVTRNSVQKSVCVLSKLPVYGLIQAKLELITHAYFQGRDFSQVALLEDTYKTLNISLTESLLQDSQVFVGLSCRDLLQKFQHKLLMLFKLILLERRVLFFSSPVKPICTSLLTLVSLFPGMIERGLVEAASYTANSKTSPRLRVTNIGDVGGDFVGIGYHNDNAVSCKVSERADGNSNYCSSQTVNKVNNRILDWSVFENATEKRDLSSDSLTFIPCISGSADDQIKVTCDDINEPAVDSESPGVHSGTVVSLENTCQAVDSVISNPVTVCTSSPLTIQVTGVKSQDPMPVEKPYVNVNVPAVREMEPSPNMEDLLETEDDIANWDADRLMLEIDDVLSDGLVGDVPAGADQDDVVSHTNSQNVLDFPDGIHNNRTENTHGRVMLSDGDQREIANSTPSNLVTDDFGLPLSVFTKGVLLHPYLSLHLFDLLDDINVRGFVIGATNVLFKQKTHLVDVVVEVSEARIDFHDPELRRQLALSTADLRFADHLVKSISDDKGDIFLDSTEWEGGDDWLRAQFRAYLLSLLRTVNGDDERLLDDFNESFVAAWKTTHNYKQWKSSCKTKTQINDIPLGHPFHGQLAMSDVKLRLSQVLQNADRNKKINAVVSQTGRVVTQTGKAVGGAITSAKSAVTTWFGSFGGSRS